VPQTGLDACISDGFARFKGHAIAIVCNQASVSGDYVHALDHLLPLHKNGGLQIACVLGPQHGIWGHTQDNMVEWQGYRDPRTGLLFHSLYGEHREPTRAMLQGVGRLVFDVPDVGARYYTFVWTLANCMKACAEHGVPVTVLDRPNPIGGIQVEGPVLQPQYASFVGLHPLPTRHGMTVGELATYFRAAYYPSCDLEVVRMEGWERAAYQDETEFGWAVPSPNMPTVDTAVVYPGQCLLEGTRMSEGRGTTRPFEVFGAPWIEAWEFTGRLNALGLSGVHFRPYVYQPTFQKFAGELCQGAFIHVTDRSAYRPVLTSVAVMQEAARHDRFEWLLPPYEYEETKMPFDILAGNAWLRSAIEGLEPLAKVRDRMDSEAAEFEPVRQGCLLY
jgi:uncharacterized protein YbbC (DUF1343 family)